MKRQMNIEIDSDTLSKFDVVRGMATRSAYIRKMIENEIAAANGNLLQDRTVYGMIQNRHVGGSANVQF